MPAAAVFAIVGAAAATAGAIDSKVRADKLSDQAREIGEKNAQILERQADQGRKVMGHQLGQFDRQAGQFTGTQTAAVSSAGVTQGGSASALRTDSIQNLKTDRTNLYDSYQNKIDEIGAKATLARDTGSMQADQITAQGWASLWGGIAQAGNSMGNAFNYMG